MFLLREGFTQLFTLGLDLWSPCYSLLRSWDSRLRPSRPLGLYFSLHALFFASILGCLYPLAANAWFLCFSSEGWWGYVMGCSTWRRVPSGIRQRNSFHLPLGFGPQGMWEEGWWSPAWLGVHRPGDLLLALQTLLVQLGQGIAITSDAHFSRLHAEPTTHLLTSGFPHWHQDRDVLPIPSLKMAVLVFSTSVLFSVWASLAFLTRSPPLISFHSLKVIRVSGHHLSFLQFNCFPYKMLYCILCA